jgi:hypothetical protein
MSWDKKLPSATRFTILPEFNNEAVRDNETGLVWERSPATTLFTWLDATRSCSNKNVAGRKGWRLPSMPELASLVDPTVPPMGPTLPAGHPFTNVQSQHYWTATSAFQTTVPNPVWFVNFIDGIVTVTDKTSLSALAWCVRGPMNAYAY